MSPPVLQTVTILYQVTATTTSFPPATIVWLVLPGFGSDDGESLGTKSLTYSPEATVYTLTRPLPSPQKMCMLLQKRLVTSSFAPPTWSILGSKLTHRCLNFAIKPFLPGSLPQTSSLTSWFQNLDT